jgi:hypothetical protein
MDKNRAAEEDNWEDEWDEENTETSSQELSKSHKGPFGVESVDAIVYSRAEDNPELRLAASYIPISPKLKVKDSKPVKPMKKTFDKWVPGSESEKDFISIQEERRKQKKSPQEKEMLPAVRIVLIVTIAIVPLMVGWFLIQAGLNFY